MRAEGRRQRAESESARRATVRGFGRLRLSVLTLLTLSALLVTPLRAGPTQEDFFKSMQRTREIHAPRLPSLPASFDPTPFVIAAAGLLLLLLVLMAMRQNRTARKPAAPLRSPRKLGREVAKRISLKSREWRQVKAAADQQACASPLTLLLCPSLLTKATQDPDARLDRKILGDVARKLVTDER
jgi:hypothetical protein